MKTFNAGDWVRYKGIAKINSITHTGYHLSNGYITSGDNGEMKHWVVKIGEWCWVGKQLRQLKSIIKEEYRVLYEFKNIERDMDGYETYHYVLESQLEGYTQPFIGELPTFLDEVEGR